MLRRLVMQQQQQIVLCNLMKQINANNLFMLGSSLCLASLWWCPAYFYGVPLKRTLNAILTHHFIVYPLGTTIT